MTPIQSAADLLLPLDLLQQDLEPRRRERCSPSLSSLQTACHCVAVLPPEQSTDNSLLKGTSAAVPDVPWRAARRGLGEDAAAAEMDILSWLCGALQACVEVLNAES
ncbi:hypothetical protein EYF80_062486 [Liparis tanakae]|uniref:Uncharacterized protein n=1 Tax=Liparis tanakae TaxID=230148 RepID=A0A4Z2EFQ7_9TELE|nr:hypothetical protein EYF80_062486 [Liparis tanakae]